jgi:hypothetical protein
LPYWDDQRTDSNHGCAGFPGATCGIFTSVTGSAPNRIFNIEWRTVYFANTAQAANYELRLYEGQPRFDVIYGQVALGNSGATGEHRKTTPSLTNLLYRIGRWGCWWAKPHSANLRNTNAKPYGEPNSHCDCYSYRNACGDATATATPTATATATPTETATPFRHPARLQLSQHKPQPQRLPDRIRPNYYHLHRSSEQDSSRARCASLFQNDVAL